MKRGLLTVAAACLAWALAIRVSGGLIIPLGFALLRARAPERPMAVGLAAILLFAALYRDDARRGLASAARAVIAAAPALALALSLAVALHAWHYNTFTAGGADSYGYVNQAYQWARGELPRAQPLLLDFPFPSADLMQTPLGYRPGPQPHTMVPTYSPGLPLLMALSLVVGAWGPYLVNPLCAGLLIWLAYLLGSRAVDRLVGVTAALVLATSPIVLYQSEWPMSDIPAGALWTAALVVAVTGRPGRMLIAGTLTALALLVRPNLLPLILIPLAFGLFRIPGWPARLRSALWFGVPVAVAAMVVAALNTIWFGAPWRSGYGSNDDLYSLASVWPNLQRYPVWLWQSQTPFVLTAFVPLLPWPCDRSTRRALLPSLAMIAGILICYLLYFYFEAWWYLRFLLPGYAALAVLMAAGYVALVRRAPSPWGPIGGTLLLAVVASSTMHYSAGAGVFGFLSGERRYIDMARFADQALPANALIFAMQHSGSVRFYGGRYTLRYDFVDPEWSARLTAELEQRGYHPFLLIDDWEIPEVQRQFRFPASPALPWPLLARLRDFGGVSLYDMGTVRGPLTPVAVAASQGSPCCLPRAPLKAPTH